MHETAKKISSSPLFAGNDGGLCPEWFSGSRQRGREEFESLPMPAANDEMWRFSDPKAFALDRYRDPEPVRDPRDLVARSAGLGESSARLVFGNNRLLEASPPPADLLGAGLVVSSIEEACRTHGAIVRNHFMAQEARLGSRKFAALHRAGSLAGAFIFVPRGLRVPKPIEVFHWVEGREAAVFPHTLVVCEDGSSATVVDCFRSADGEPAFACGVNDLVALDSARLSYVAVQEWSPEAVAVHINSTEAGRDAACLGMQVNLGGRFVRSESYSRMTAEGARSDMLAVNVAAADQVIDQRTFQDHAAPRATSDLLFQNALAGRSRTIFSGVIRVEPGAHQTDAYQKVRNIMLSDEAEANSMPGLEIEADDVRCSHGATTSQVDERELFYLLARGIRPAVARQLIVMGFFNTVLERLPDERLREHIAGAVSRRLASVE